jgi:hypothetical protein
MEFISDWIRTSREYVQAKEPLWTLLEDLYRNRRPLSLWWTQTGQLQAKIKDLRGRVRSDETVSVAPIVNSFVHKAFRRVLPSKSDSLRVKAEPRFAQPSIEDTEISTEDKLTQAVIEDLREGHFRSAFATILLYLGIWGFVGAKVRMFQRRIPIFLLGPDGGIVSEQVEVISCPRLEAIKPHNLLPDWAATTPDVQSWTGIGNRAETTYYTAMDRFKYGTYTLNKKEVQRRWKDAQTATLQSTGEKEYFTDKWIQETGESGPKATPLAAWEWHGRVPNRNKDGWTEVVATILTDRGADDPDSGVLVRLQEGAIVRNGYRPYVFSSFFPIGEVFGQGSIEPNLDIIHTMSTLLNIMVNNAKISSRQWLVRQGSSAFHDIVNKYGGDVTAAGQVVGVEEMDDIQPFPVSSYPASETTQLYQYHQNMFERRTGESDTTLGLSQREKTATEASVLAQMASTPYDNIVSWLDESFLFPFGKLFLALQQQFTEGDRTVEVPGPDNNPRYEQISTAEARTGAYRIEWLVDLPDQKKMAKAQSLERLMPQLADMQPMLLQEGYKISFSTLMRRYMTYLEIDRIDQVIVPLTDEERMMQQQQQEFEQMQGEPPIEGEPMPPPPQAEQPPGGTPPPPEEGTAGEDPEFQAALQEAARELGQSNSPYGTM